MKVLVVDDHALIREALRGVLRELKPEATVFEARDSEQALQLLANHADAALVLLDLSLPDRDGFAVLADIRHRLPATAVVVLSAFHDRSNVVRALEGGALGFIPKSASREVMVSALNLVFSGGIYVPPEILSGHDAPADICVHVRPGSSPADVGLTDRQVAVLALMMQGKSNKAICRALDLAEPTVKNHVTAILKALKVSNRTEAVVAAGALGWDLRRPADAGR